ncbi:MAG TPA: thioredoxin [Sphaerochaeta sp.]|jgi:thioredoxin 1|nr:thioredoxin [Spirochaetales bacterium]HQB54529.1 thioredoxin [Sphaerochaeta sp.]
MIVSEIIVTELNFKQEVLEAEEPVLVDFWAPWCGPCKIIAPAVAQIAETYKGKLKVAKVNVDDAGSLANDYNINSIPTLMVFKNGEVVGQRLGAASLSVIEGFVKQYL